MVIEFLFSNIDLVKTIPLFHSILKIWRFTQTNLKQNVLLKLWKTKKKLLTSDISSKHYAEKV